MFAKYEDVPLEIQKALDKIRSLEEKEIPMPKFIRMLAGIRFNKRECREIIEELETQGIIETHHKGIHGVTVEICVNDNSLR